MEPAEDRLGDQIPVRQIEDDAGAAMEPAENRLGDGSRNLTGLTCANGALRERFGSAAAQR